MAIHTSTRGNREEQVHRVGILPSVDVVHVTQHRNSKLTSVITDGLLETANGHVQSLHRFTPIFAGDLPRSPHSQTLLPWRPGRSLVADIYPAADDCLVTRSGLSPGGQVAAQGHQLQKLALSDEAVSSRPDRTCSAKPVTRPW